MQISYDTARFAFYLGFSDDMHSMTLAGLPLGMMHALVVWPCRVNLTSVTLWFSMQFLRTTELCTAINSVRGNRFLRVTAFSRRKKCYTNLLLCQKNISSFVWCCSAFQSNSLLLSYFIPCYLLLEEMSGLGGDSSCAQIIRALYREGKRLQAADGAVSQPLSSLYQQ